MFCHFSTTCSDDEKVDIAISINKVLGEEQTFVEDEIKQNYNTISLGVVDKVCPYTRLELNTYG